MRHPVDGAPAPVPVLTPPRPASARAQRWHDNRRDTRRIRRPPTRWTSLQAPSWTHPPTTRPTCTSESTADAARPFRARGDASARPAVLGSAAHHAQPGRCRGPRPGDLRQGVRGVPPVPPGHQLQGVDVPHPHQHLHQHVPQEAARAAAVGCCGDRGLPAGPRRVAHLHGAALRRDRGARPPARHRGEAGPAGPAGRLPHGGLPRRCRRIRLQGDRGDHGYPHRHRHVAICTVAGASCASC